MPDDEPTAAVAGVKEDHAPPVALLLSDVAEAWHTLVVPLIKPASGEGFTVTTLVAANVPQPLVTTYEIVAVPAVTPVMIPIDGSTVAVPGLIEIQVPPPAASERVVVAVGHTVAVPVIVPVFGKGFTVTTVVAYEVPQALVTAYNIVAVPPAIPCTTPDDTPTMAVAGAAEVQTPPGPTLLLSVSVFVGHIAAAPLITPGSGKGFTVTTLVAA